MNIFRMNICMDIDILTQSPHMSLNNFMYHVVMS